MEYFIQIFLIKVKGCTRTHLKNTQFLSKSSILVDKFCPHLCVLGVNLSQNFCPNTGLL